MSQLYPSTIYKEDLNVLKLRKIYFTISIDMQTQVGVIKQISGLVVAVNQYGVSRVLKVGDAL